MHSCLAVPEIFRLIVTKIYDPAREALVQYPWEKLKALNALARTCQAFTSTCLDAIWYAQLDLAPLCRCLSEDVLGRKLVRHDGDDNLRVRALVLQGDICPEDCKRIRSYARRIRILGHPAGEPEGTLSTDRIDPMVFPIIFSKCSLDVESDTGPLFPNLMRLYMGLEDFSLLAWYPRLVIGPQLNLKKITLYATRISVEAGAVRLDWDNVLTILAPVLPTLDSLDFLLPPQLSFDESNICRFNYNRSYRCLLKTIRGLVSPTVLDIISVVVDTATLIHISHLRSLIKLSFSTESGNINRKILKKSSALSELPNLQELRLSVDDQADCSVVVCQLASHSLERLEIIRSDDFDERWDIDALITSLSSSKCTASLLTFKVCCVLRAANSDNSASPITATTLNYLSTFPNLHSISIYLNGNVLLGPEDLQTIATTWTTLRVLDFRTRQKKGKPSIHLTDLLQFARLLPDLQVIRLRVGAETRGLTFAKSGLNILTKGGVAARDLRMLDVGSSPISGPEAVACLLGAAFPRLSELYYGWEYVGEHGERLESELSPTERQYLADWKRVKKGYLKKLFDARRVNFA